MHHRRHSGRHDARDDVSPRTPARLPVQLGLSPGKGKAGIIPHNIVKEGLSFWAHSLRSDPPARARHGQSTHGIGGDLIGTTHRRALSSPIRHDAVIISAII
jgi:hypothetical protein